jgi:hypothetical protein
MCSTLQTGCSSATLIRPLPRLSPRASPVQPCNTAAKDQGRGQEQVEKDRFDAFSEMLYSAAPTIEALAEVRDTIHAFGGEGVQMQALENEQMQSPPMMCAFQPGVSFDAQSFQPGVSFDAQSFQNASSYDPQSFETADPRSLQNIASLQSFLPCRSSNFTQGNGTGNDNQQMSIAEFEEMLANGATEFTCDDLINGTINPYSPDSDPLASNPFLSDSDPLASDLGLISASCSGPERSCPDQLRPDSVANSKSSKSPGSSGDTLINCTEEEFAEMWTPVL